MAASSLLQRVATAVVLVPLVLAALFLLPPLGWALFVLAVVTLAAYEWGRLCRTDARVAQLFAALVAVDGVLRLVALRDGIAAGFPDGLVRTVCGVAAVFWLVVAPAWLRGGWQAAGRWWTLVVGFVVLHAAWLALVELQARSPWLVLTAMAVVWIADTAAYFAGRRFGRRKLAPAISPGKTWEGVWGGLAGVAAFAVVIVAVAPAAVIPTTPTPLVVAAIVGFAMLLAGVSVVGDLFESLLKRQAGVKDSGSLLPGHGGVLDRVDALLAAMPLAALAATTWTVGLQGA